MKVAFLSDDFPPLSFGGAGISTYELAKGMKDAGHEVFVITTCRNKEEVGNMKYHDLEIYKIMSNYSGKWRWYVSLYNFPVVRQVENLLKKIRPDIVHINNIHYYLSYHCLKISKKYAGAVVFTARDVMSFNYAKLDTERYLKNLDCRTTWFDHIRQTKKRWNPLRNILIKNYLKYADKIFAVSFALKKALEQNGINKVEVIHTGADFTQADPSREKIENFINKFGLKDKKVIFFGGRLSEAKGGRKVLEAMTEVVKKFPNAVLLVAANEGLYMQKIKNDAEMMSILKNIVFTGWIGREEMKIAYAVSQVVLVPSICLDSFPRIVLESMASGKPVIGTCYGGSPEIIEDGLTGYIVNPMFPKEISEKILYLFENAKKMEEFGKSGRERVRNYFNLKNKVNEYAEAYKKS